MFPLFIPLLLLRMLWELLMVLDCSSHLLHIQIVCYSLFHCSGKQLLPNDGQSLEHFLWSVIVVYLGSWKLFLSPNSVTPARETSDASMMLYWWVKLNKRAACESMCLCCLTCRICSGTSSSTQRAWRRCWRCVTSCSTMLTPVAATRRMTRSSRPPAVWTVAGGTSVPCLWRGGWGEQGQDVQLETSGCEAGGCFLNQLCEVKLILLLSGSRKPGVSGVSSWTTTLALKTGWRQLSSPRPTQTLPTSSTPAPRKSWRSLRSDDSGIFLKQYFTLADFWKGSTKGRPEVNRKSSVKSCHCLSGSGELVQTAAGPTACFLWWWCYRKGHIFHEADFLIWDTVQLFKRSILWGACIYRFIRSNCSVNVDFCHVNKDLTRWWHQGMVKHLMIHPLGTMNTKCKSKRNLATGCLDLQCWNPLFCLKGEVEFSS